MRGPHGTWIVPDRDGPGCAAVGEPRGGRMSWEVRVVRNRYADSVRLMGSRGRCASATASPACEVAMGTAANLERAGGAGGAAEARPGDVVIAVDGEDGGGDEVWPRPSGARGRRAAAERPERGRARPRRCAARSTAPTSR